MEQKNKFGVWYMKWLDKWIPAYSVLSVIVCFIWNSMVYSGTQFLMRDVKHYDLTTVLDKKIPFVPEWIYVYLVCFGFWAVNYILISREGKEQWFRFAVGDMLSRAVCGVFFICLPTMNVRPQIMGNSLAEELTHWMYQMDMPYNLFPSIHCLVSWFCYVGIRDSKKIPKWYKRFSFVFALFVFAATQMTKQHYLWDIPASIVIAEICFYIGWHTQWYQKLEAVFDKAGGKIFGSNGGKTNCEGETLPL